MALKVCTKCREAKEVARFSANRSSRCGLQSECKDCRKSRAAAYYATHSEERIAYTIAYRNAHPEKAKVAHASWFSAHREEKRAYCAAYGAAHREERSSYNAAYAAGHREERAARQSAHRAAHPEIQRAMKARKRARKRQVGGSWTPADKSAQIARQKDRCFYCKRKLRKGEAFHFDHVIPLAGERTSWNGPENMVAACPTCNMAKSATDPMDFAGIMF